MKHAMLATVAAMASLAAVSVKAAELPGPGEEAFGAAATVSDQELSTKRAKGDDGSPAISCVECTTNGTSNITGNAFQNAVGVFTVVQNSGNQVFLNTVTVVNVSISK